MRPIRKHAVTLQMSDADKYLEPNAKRDAGVSEPVAPDTKAQLDHIAEVSRNARTTWFGLLGLLAFVGVTLLGHIDAHFFAKNAATQLPIIGITVPVEAFFVTAPLLVASVYAYLHLYLMTLWDGLADTPAIVYGRPLIDRVFPWLISYAALWYRNRARQDGSARPRALGLVVVAVSLFLGWAFGLVVIGGLWVRSMPAHNEILTLWIGLCFWLSLSIGTTSFLTAKARLRGASASSVARANWPRRIVSLFAMLALGCTSWEATEGGLLPNAEDGLPPFLVSADLREAELTMRPSDWKPFDIWLRDLRRERAIGDPEQKPLVPTPDEMKRWSILIAALDAPDLQNRDLRKADAVGAFLPGADLRSAVMQGARFTSAKLQAVLFSNADMRFADFAFAEMQGANLDEAILKKTVLQSAKLQGASLAGVDASEAEWIEIHLEGSKLASAQLHKTNLMLAKLHGADLTGASIDGADLTRAFALGADLSDAYIKSAKLGGAVFRGSNLSKVWIEASHCNSGDPFHPIGDVPIPGDFSSTVLHATEFGCVGDDLTKPQLRNAVGDSDTKLPENLSIWSCIDKSSVGREDGIFIKELSAAIAYHPPDWIGLRMPRAQFEGIYWCNPDHADVQMRSPHPVPN